MDTLRTNIEMLYEANKMALNELLEWHKHNPDADPELDALQRGKAYILIDINKMLLDILNNPDKIIFS